MLEHFQFFWRKIVSFSGACLHRVEIMAMHLKKTDKCLISAFCKINIGVMISRTNLLIGYDMEKMYIEFCILKLHRTTTISRLCIEF